MLFGIELYICLIVKVLKYINYRLLRNFCFINLLTGETAAPRAVLTGHDYEITCAAICAELGVVISGSKGTFYFF